MSHDQSHDDYTVLGPFTLDDMPEALSALLGSAVHGERQSSAGTVQILRLIDKTMVTEYTSLDARAKTHDHALSQLDTPRTPEMAAEAYTLHVLAGRLADLLGHTYGHRSGSTAEREQARAEYKAQSHEHSAMGERWTYVIARFAEEANAEAQRASAAAS